MSPAQFFTTGKGRGNRQSRVPPAADTFQVQATAFRPPHFPFQPLPTPAGPPPFRFDLSQLLSADDVTSITNAGVLVCHAVGDTGDYRGQEQDFVAGLMEQDVEGSPADKKPAFLYHLGDVVYFAGDIDKYGDNFYASYKDYRTLHCCHPREP